MRRRAADALDGEILNCAQQLRLRGQREVGYFVEEERAAVRVLELAAAAAHARGRSLFDAEQLRLEERFHECRAVDRRQTARYGGVLNS